MACPALRGRLYSGEAALPELRCVSVLRVRSFTQESKKARKRERIRLAADAARRGPRGVAPSLPQKG